MQAAEPLPLEWNLHEKFGFIPIPPNELELFPPVKTIEEAVNESG
jgi:hypothetical protein